MELKKCPHCGGEAQITVGEGGFSGRAIHESSEAEAKRLFDLLNRIDAIAAHREGK